MKQGIFKQRAEMMVIGNLGAILLMMSVPLQARLVRGRRAWHEQLFVLGARFRYILFPAFAAAIALSLAIVVRTDRILSPQQFSAFMWAMGLATTCLVLIGFLRTYRKGNAALMWQTERVASLHIEVKHLTSKETRSFLKTAPALWRDARAMGFSELTMDSPLLIEEARCRRLARLMVAQAQSEGISCRAELITAHTWSWIKSATFYAKHDRKWKQPAQSWPSWGAQVFQRRAAGFRLITEG